MSKSVMGSPLTITAIVWVCAGERQSGEKIVATQTTSRARRREGNVVVMVIFAVNWSN
jgi:hypothetical protein